MGVPVTAPARTLLDLAEKAGERDLEGALNQARQHQRITEREIVAVRDRYPGHRGLAGLARVVPEPTNEDFSRSQAEVLMWQLINRALLPLPRRNFKVHGFELDFWWPQLRLNVEVDGYRWHAPRDRVNRDRDRDSSLAVHGIQVLRFTWDQLQQPEVVLARLAATIALRK